MPFEIFKALFRQMGWLERQLPGHSDCHASDANLLLRLRFLLKSGYLSPSSPSLGGADCIKVVSATLAQHLFAASCVLPVISQICLFNLSAMEANQKGEVLTRQSRFFLGVGRDGGRVKHLFSRKRRGPHAIPKWLMSLDDSLQWWL